MTLRDTFKHHVGEDRRNKFLLALTVAPSITRAAKMAGVAPQNLGKERQINPEFDEAILKIMAERKQRCEDTIMETVVDTGDWKAAAKFIELCLKAESMKADQGTKIDWERLRNDICPL